MEKRREEGKNEKPLDLNSEKKDMKNVYLTLTMK